MRSFSVRHRQVLTFLTFIPLLRLIPEGGMSPLPVRKDSGGKDCCATVCLCAYSAEASEVVAANFHPALLTEALH